MDTIIQACYLDSRLFFTHHTLSQFRFSYEKLGCHAVSVSGFSVEIGEMRASCVLSENE
jgi:hypothetical protein